MSETINPFQLSSGVQFMLDPNTPAIVVGPGGCRRAELVPIAAGGTTYTVVFEPSDSTVVAWWYKAEWHLDTIERLVGEFLACAWILGWSDAAQTAISARAKHVL